MTFRLALYTRTWNAVMILAAMMINWDPLRAEDTLVEILPKEVDFGEISRGDSAKERQVSERVVTIRENGKMANIAEVVCSCSCISASWDTTDEKAESRVIIKLTSEAFWGDTVRKAAVAVKLRDGRLFKIPVKMSHLSTVNMLPRHVVLSVEPAETQANVLMLAHIPSGLNTKSVSHDEKRTFAIEYDEVEIGSETALSLISQKIEPFPGRSGLFKINLSFKIQSASRPKFVHGSVVLKVDDTTVSAPITVEFQR